MKEKYGILGFPVEHSLSPVIHNTAFRHLNISAGYERIGIDPGRFDETI